MTASRPQELIDQGYKVRVFENTPMFVVTVREEETAEIEEMWRVLVDPTEMYQGGCELVSIVRGACSLYLDFWWKIVS